MSARPRLRNAGRTPRTAVVGGAVVLVTLLVLLSVVSPSLVPSPRPGAPTLALPSASHVASVTSPAPRSSVRPEIAALPTWVNVSRPGAGAPPPVYGESVAYDPADHLTLLFGGCYVAQCPGNETWAFTNGSWTNLTPRSGSPPARDYASLDFDANLGGVLLFGGKDSSGNALNDTWLFRGGSWTDLIYVGPAPPARWGAALAFDPDPGTNGSVLYGGCSGLGCGYNDTWVWQGGAGWTQLTLASPGPAINSAAMAFDPVDDYLLLFGGCGGFLCLGLSNQTWEFYGGQWWEANPSTFPAARVGAQLVYDPVGHQMVLFGGLNFTTYFSDTWSYSAGVWQELSPVSAPSPRADFGLALDPMGTGLLLVGGEGSGPSENDTWVYEVPPAVALTTSVTASEVSQPVGFNASVTGGVGPYHLSVTFGDGTGASATGTGPWFLFSHHYTFTGAFAASVNLTDSDGAMASSATVMVHVQAGPSVTANATPPDGDVGLPLAFKAHASSTGSPPFVYAWRFGDGGTATGANASHAYTSPGTYSVRVNLTDTLGATANDSFTVTIAAAPTAAVSFSPTAPNNTTAVAWHATVAGGTPPLSYAWQFGDGARSAIPSPAHTFAVPGSYTVTLWVNDSVGGSILQTDSITVSAAKVSSPPPPPSHNTTVVKTQNVTAPPPDWFWPGVGALVVLGAVGSFLLLRMGRSRAGR